MITFILYCMQSVRFLLIDRFFSAQVQFIVTILQIFTRTRSPITMMAHEVRSNSKIKSRSDVCLFEIITES
jgi:hypothetical protein